MRRIVFWVSAILPIISIAQVKEEWSARYNGSDSEKGDLAECIAVDETGNVYVAGTSGVVKYNNRGEEQWRKGGRWVILDKKWNVFVLDSTVIKYTSDGDVLWAISLPDSFENAKKIKCDSAGNVYVLGAPYGCDVWYNYDYGIVKYNTNGTLLWHARYNGPANLSDWASDFTLDEAGNVYVTGYSQDSAALFDYATVKYDTSGKELWVARYNGIESGDDFAVALTVDKYGNVYVTGETKVSSGEFMTDYCTIKYDAEGNEKWKAFYNGSGYAPDHLYGDAANSIALSESGDVYVTGVSVDSVGFEDYVTVKYAPYGEEQWVARYNGPNDWYDAPAAMAVDKSGNVYVTGQSYGSNASDYVTVKYNPNGNEQWVSRYDGGGTSHYGDCATAVTLDDACNVYVTGWCFGAEEDINSSDYVTIKYSQETGIADPAKPESFSNLEVIGSTVTYTLPVSFRITLKAYDASGRLVETLFSGTQEAGSKTIAWNPERLPEGVYFIRLEADTWSSTKKSLICR